MLNLFLKKKKFILNVYVATRIYLADENLAFFDEHAVFSVCVKMSKTKAPKMKKKTSKSVADDEDNEKPLTLNDTEEVISSKSLFLRVQCLTHFVYRFMTSSKAWA